MNMYKDHLEVVETVRKRNAAAQLAHDLLLNIFIMLAIASAIYLGLIEAD